MIKKIYICLFLAISFLNGYAQKRTNIDDNWLFHYGNSENVKEDFNYSIVNIFSKSGASEKTAIDPKFVDKDWRKLNLPHDWAVELPFVQSENDDLVSHGFKPVGGLFPDTSIGWYRKHFTVSKNDKKDRFEIQFDGVFRNASIWLNGFYIGTNQSGYVGKSYDVTDYIDFEKDNVLVVRVDATQYEGWFYEGAGIYRHVWLNQYNNLHIPFGGLFVHSNVNNKNASVNIETSVENKNLNPTNCTVYAYITDRNGKIIGKTNEEKLGLNVNETATVKQKINVSNARLWSIEDPYLYKVYAVIKENGKEVYREQTRLGIRTIKFDAKKGFFLNGKHLKIKGTNNHQDHAGIGTALPDYVQYYRIKKLKELGFILTKPGTSGEFQYVIILNPFPVIKNIYENKEKDERYNALVGRMQEVGAKWE